jgi:Right handed beta helix region
MATGISLTSTAAFVIASIDNSHFKGASGNCLAVGSNSIANVTNSVFSNCGAAAATVTASGSFLSLNNNTIQNSTTGVNAGSGSTLRMSNNDLYDNTTGIAAVGSSFLSANNNRVSGGTPGTTASSAIPIR